MLGLEYRPQLLLLNNKASGEEYTRIDSQVFDYTSDANMRALCASW